MPIINPRDPINRVKPLWCVYGHEAWPKIICCKLLWYPFSEQCVIWGYSVYDGIPGFRTLGVGIDKFIQEFSKGGFEPIFYDDIDEALDCIKNYITPKVGD